LSWEHFNFSYSDTYFSLDEFSVPLCNETILEAPLNPCTCGKINAVELSLSKDEESGSETLSLTVGDSYSESLWVSVNGDKKGPFSVDMVKIQFDTPEEKYCVSYASCDKEDEFIEILPCSDSLYCSKPDVSLRTTHISGELELLFGYKASPVHLDRLLLRLENHDDIDLNLSESPSPEEGRVEYIAIVDGNTLKEITGFEVSVIYVFGCGSNNFTNEGNVEESLIFTIDDCSDDAEIVLLHDPTELFIRGNGGIYSLYRDGTKVGDSFTPPKIMKMDLEFIGTRGIRFELKAECGGIEKSVENRTLTAAGILCNDTCDVFVTIFSPILYWNATVSKVYLTDDENYYASTAVGERGGSTWRLCKGITYNLTQTLSNDRVEIRTHDNLLLYDSYSSSQKMFTVTSEMNNEKECGIPDSFDFEVTFNETDWTASVKWNGTLADGTILDIWLDDHIFVKTVDGTVGEISFYPTEYVFGKSGHTLTIREVCATPDETFIYYLFSGAECDDPCVLVTHEDQEQFKSGYVTISNKDEPHTIYFMGAPAGLHSGGFYQTREVSVCGHDLSVSIVLPNGDTAGDEGHRFVLAQNIPVDTSVYDPVVFNSSFASSPVDFHGCISCVPARIFSSEAVRIDNKSEMIRLHHVFAVGEFLLVSFVNGSTGNYTVGPPSENLVEIPIDDPQEQYCFGYAACNDSLDMSNTICVESSFCRPSSINFSMEHKSHELHVELLAGEGLGPLLTIDYVRVYTEDGEVSIDITSSDSVHPDPRNNIVFTITGSDFRKLFGRKYCSYYSISGCGMNYTSDASCGTFSLDDGAIIGCIIAGIAIVVIAALVIPFIVLANRRGEKKEMELEMVFPTDEADEGGEAKLPAEKAEKGESDVPDNETKPEKGKSAEDEAKKEDNDDSSVSVSSASDNDDDEDDSDKSDKSEKKEESGDDDSGKSDKSEKKEERSDDDDDSESSDDSVSVSSASDDD